MCTRQTFHEPFPHWIACSMFSGSRLPHTLFLHSDQFQTSHTANARYEQHVTYWGEEEKTSNRSPSYVSNYHIFPTLINVSYRIAEKKSAMGWNFMYILWIHFAQNQFNFEEFEMLFFLRQRTTWRKKRSSALYLITNSSKDNLEFRVSWD